jgi:cysteine desulfurase
MTEQRLLGWEKMLRDENRIYLDNNATTCVAEEVVVAMSEWLRSNFANPSSNHQAARYVKQRIEEARSSTASLIGCRGAQLIFTSGATEGIATAFNSALTGREGGIIASSVEHPAVLENASKYQAMGRKVVLVGVEASGQLDFDAFVQALDESPSAFVALMMANNETGVVFPYERAVHLCREKGVPVLLDASQTVGKLPVNVRTLQPDYLVLSAHKFHGPKGIGALYVRRGAPYSAVFPGGGQERERRSGTENTPAIIGMGVASSLAGQAIEEGLNDEIAALRDRLERGICQQIPEAIINGANCNRGERLPNTTSASFKYASGIALLQHLDELGISVSSGSACSENEQTASHVLKAMGVSSDYLYGTVRFGLSRFTLEAEIDYVLQHLPRVYRLACSASTH